MTSGLHICKPGNDPVIGQIKTFTVEQRTAVGSGKAWTKISSKASDQGGQPYKILSVKPTGHTDSYGNVSFNLEIEPSSSGATQQQPSQPNSDPTSKIQDTPRQFMMRAANLLVMSVNAAKSVFGEDYERELATSLFIQAARNGMIDQMPAKPLSNGSPPEQSQPEPESDEPPF